MRKSGCGIWMTQSLYTMKSEMKIWRSWRERRRNLRAYVSGGLVMGTLAQGVSWGI